MWCWWAVVLLQTAVFGHVIPRCEVQLSWSGRCADYADIAGNVQHEREGLGLKNCCPAWSKARVTPGKQEHWTRWDNVENRKCSWRDESSMETQSLSFTVRATYDVLPTSAKHHDRVINILMAILEDKWTAINSTTTSIQPPWTWCLCLWRGLKQPGAALHHLKVASCAYEGA